MPTCAGGPPRRGRCLAGGRPGFQPHGGTAYSLEYPVARLFRDARIGKNIPVAEEMVLAHIAQHDLGLPRPY
ncbi:MAG: acyl-CoA dehydrogenase domain protein [Streptosporangiaceae bacterium]|nr:acyl-CoA dehydrogenase domain protein [Streptosporangiaceae bacterium]